MSIENHIQQLVKKHSSIDTKIHKIEIKPYQNDPELHQLKKLKLKIKEEIEKLQLVNRLKPH